MQSNTSQLNTYIAAGACINVNATSTDGFSFSQIRFAIENITYLKSWSVLAIIKENIDTVHFNLQNDSDLSLIKSHMFRFNLVMFC